MAHLAHRRSSSPRPSRTPFTASERSILEALMQLGKPSSVREIITAIPVRRRPEYCAVKATANALARSGVLHSERVGQGTRYSPPDIRAMLAQRIASLLAVTDNPDGVIQDARALLSTGRG